MKKSSIIFVVMLALISTALCGCARMTDNDYAEDQPSSSQQSALDVSVSDVKGTDQEVEQEAGMLLQEAQADNDSDKQIAIQKDCDEYLICIPPGYSDWTFDFNPDWYGYGNGHRDVGCDMGAFDENGCCIFRVTCYSDDWGPQSGLTAQRIGPAAKRSGFSIWITVVGDDMTQVEFEEYKSWVRIF